MTHLTRGFAPAPPLLARTTALAMTRGYSPQQYEYILVSAFVWVTALSFIQCFDTVGLMTGTPSHLLNTMTVVPNVLFWNGWTGGGREANAQPADPSSPGKQPIPI